MSQDQQERVNKFLAALEALCVEHGVSSIDLQTTYAGWDHESSIEVYFDGQYNQETSEMFQPIEYNAGSSLIDL